MTLAHSDPPRGRGWPNLARWRNRVVASPAFQSWASKFPLTRGMARREGERIFDIVAGFVHSQILFALVELDVFGAAADGPLRAATLAHRHGLDPQRAEALLAGGAALGLLRRHKDGRYALTQTGAALTGVPGLVDMIRHHGAFYRDLADPVALLRGEGETELARFWPYVFGAEGPVDPEIAARYSDLMATSQALVAEETLRAVSLAGIRHLVDVGGGTGAFIAAAARAAPGTRFTLFDLPQVAPGAGRRFAAEGLTDRVTIVPGSFRDDPLPQGADAISLVRVLYDHADDTVDALLAKVFATLPPGGRVIVSEPMSGGARPARPGDSYFAFYTMAMGTGRARSAAEIAARLSAAGFSGAREHRTSRPFVTSVVSAQRDE